MKNKFKNFFYLDEEDESVDVESPSKPVHVQKDPPPIRTKKEKRVFEDDSNTFSKQTKNVVSIQAANSLKNSKVVIAEPRVYAEAQDISEHLKNKRTVIVNLQRIEREAGIRIIDFLSGTVYALGGDIQRIGTDIFLCTPDNIEVSGEISTFSLDEF